MAKYFYDKYSKGYTPWSAETKYNEGSFVTDLGIDGYDQPPTWDGNKYVFHGTYDRGWKKVPIWEDLGQWELEARYRHYFSMQSYGGGKYRYTYSDYRRTRTITKGSYIETIVAEDGTYPDDGLHSDGYWYVKKGLAVPQLKINVDGVWKAISECLVNIDGVWRNVFSAQININGVWKDTKQ